MHTFVTGATGLLGGNLVHLLLDQGHEVTALVRDPAKLPVVLGDAAAAVRPVTGDVRDVAGWAGHLAGVDTVFHTAAYFREYYAPGEHDALLRATNVDAVRDLLAAAARAGVATVVHTSSSGVLRPRRDGLPADESSSLQAGRGANRYFLSKVAAEGVVRAAVERLPVRVPMVLPGWMWGPGDAGPTASGQLVLDFAGRRLPAVPSGGTMVVDARDVAATMLAAAGTGASGERYVVAGRYLELTEIVAELERQTGVRAPRLRVPGPIALAVAGAAELGARVTGRPTVVTRAGVRTMLERTRIDSGRAARELGATFRPFSTTVADTLAWFRAAGRLPAPAPASAG